MITCLSPVAYNPELLSLGTANGVVKDFDLSLRTIVRRTSLHSSRVVSLASRDHWLLSCEEDRGLALLDYSNGSEEEADLSGQVEGAFEGAVLLATKGRVLVAGTMGLLLVHMHTQTILAVLRQQHSTLVSLSNIPDASSKHK